MVILKFEMIDFGYISYMKNPDSTIQTCHSYADQCYPKSERSLCFIAFFDLYKCIIFAQANYMKMPVHCSNGTKNQNYDEF